MQKLVDAIEKKIDTAYNNWNDATDTGVERYWDGQTDGLAEARDLVLEMQQEIAAVVTRTVLEQLVEMKMQVLEALEADLKDAVDNDRRMQESVLSEKVAELQAQIKTLESVYGNGATDE